MWAVDLETMQPFADTLPAVGRYCTDGAAVYGKVVWPEDEWHVVLLAKETFTLEGINADLRTYLGRLKRRSRCFSRSAARLAEAILLFLWHYNRGQRLINAKARLRHTLPLFF
jgi:IS1 family transposase